MKKVDVADVAKVVEPVLEAEGFELIEIEFKNEQSGWVLRLYIDKEGGVSIDDCANMSREVGNILDVEDAIQIPYNLEVSSPGLNRPLRKPEHFKKVIGEDIKVKTNDPIGGAKNFKAELLDACDTWIKIGSAGEEITIELDNIAKANLIYKF